MKDTCIVLMAHICKEKVKQNYDRLKLECSEFSDVFLLFDESRKKLNESWFKSEDVCLFNIEDIEQKYYMFTCSKAGKLMPGNCTFPILEFTRKYNYKYYWRIEYDVIFNGNWKVFFAYFENNKSDLLATTIYENGFRPEWRWWSSLRNPIQDLVAKPIRCFLPICRLSKSAVDILIKACADGWRGHEEVSVPTILNAYGLKIEDIGGEGEYVSPENVNRFYTNTPSLAGLAPGTFVCRPKMCEEVIKPNMLYHSLK